VPVAARELDLAADLADPALGRTQVIFLVEQRDELLGADESKPVEADESKSVETVAP
jgi:hypothetical protein